MPDRILMDEVRVNTSLKLGEHFIVDLSECDRDLLMDADRSYELFSAAVRRAGLTVVDEGLFKFAPHGFTAFLLLSESHASLHAWPEFGYCAIDLFTCNIGQNMLPLIEELKTAFKADDFVLKKVDREAEISRAELPFLMLTEQARS